MNKIFNSLVFIALSLMMSCHTDKSKNKDQSEQNTNNINLEMAGITLTDTYWKLIEVNGQAVPTDTTKNTEAYLRFKADNTVEGTSGCNRMGGSYTINEGNRIAFSKLFSTMMACEDMRIEQAMNEALQRVDNYSLSDNTLSLNKARMASLLRFVAVKEK